jgi:hypothetical protein
MEGVCPKLAWGGSWERGPRSIVAPLSISTPRYVRVPPSTGRGRSPNRDTCQPLDRPSQGRVSALNARQANVRPQRTPCEFLLSSTGAISWQAHRSVRRMQHEQPSPARGYTADDVRKVLAVVPDTVPGRRDRAIILTLVLLQTNMPGNALADDAEPGRCTLVPCMRPAHSRR